LRGKAEWRQLKAERHQDVCFEGVLPDACRTWLSRVERDRLAREAAAPKEDIRRGGSSFQLQLESAWLQATDSFLSAPKASRFDLNSIPISSLKPATCGRELFKLEALATFDKRPAGTFQKMRRWGIGERLVGSDKGDRNVPLL
jgi:hypothetical protein